MPVQQGIMSAYQLGAHDHSGVGQGGLVDPAVIDHDALLNFVLNEHKLLTNTIAQVLSDHNKAAHDAQAINAGQVDGIEGAEIIQRDGSIPLTGAWDIGAFSLRGLSIAGDGGGVVVLGDLINQTRVMGHDAETLKIFGQSNGLGGLRVSKVLLNGFELNALVANNKIDNSLKWDGKAFGDLDGKIKLNTPTELTINAGAITVTKSYHRIDGEGDAADTLSTINGGVDGMILVIQSENNARVITVDEAGNVMLTGANCVLTVTDCKLMLVFDGTDNKWVELGRCTG